LENESQENIERLQGNLKEIDKNLGAYPYEVWDKWKSLTNKITEPLTLKFGPKSGIIHSVPELNGKL